MRSIPTSFDLSDAQMRLKKRGEEEGKEGRKGGRKKRKKEEKLPAKPARYYFLTIILIK